ncbi:MAG: cache domain-containing protein [Acidobacteriota bacterium]|nr:cache domain-containing protein [Acidobacteriota bacterium]
MSVDRLEVKVSITKLLLALIVVIVPLSIIGLVLTQRSDKTLDNSVGSNFKTMAQLYASQVTQFMRERVTDVNVLASSPAVVNAVSNGAGNKGTLDTNASQVLREHKSLDPRFLSIVATTDEGKVAAASQRPPQIAYAQDANWQAAYNNGQGATKISDILDDELTKAYYVTINVPVVNPQSSQTIGVVSAAVNISDALAPFRQSQIANGARAALVNEDGIVISGPNADVFSRVKAPEYDFVRDSLGPNQGSQNGWLTAHLARGPYIVGFAGTGLKQHFANLGWVVTVSQEEHEAAAPVRQLEHFALLMVILAVFMLTLMFVYYYLHRAQRFSYIDEDVASNQPRSTAASAGAGV